MALITCHECGHRVSTEAAACPGCGAPPRQQTQPAPATPPLAASHPVRTLAPVQSRDPVAQRRASVPDSSTEPSIAWIGWIFGGIIVLFVLLMIANPEPQPSEGAASAYRQGEDRRVNDSIAVLELTAGDSAMPVERLLTLESTLHVHGFTISHDVAHRRYSRILLDSADALIGKGFTAQARTLLSTVGTPEARADSLRASRLNARIARVEEEQARESARQQRQAQAQAVEGRLERIRGLQQGGCTPPARAVRNRLSKNPDWSDDIIATTACNRVQIGMTREQAIAGWGRPRDVNRTSGTFGVHEQWVYGEYGSGYLYFEDGVLTTVQN